MKYRNIPTEIDGHRFPSKREAKRYHDLKMLLLAGEIRNLELQPSYQIEINGIFICKVNLDFRYEEKAGLQWFTRIEDSKGFDNPLSKLKRKLVEALFGIKVILT